MCSDHSSAIHDKIESIDGTFFAIDLANSSKHRNQLGHHGHMLVVFFARYRMRQQFASVEVAGLACLVACLYKLLGPTFCDKSPCSN